MAIKIVSATELRKEMKEYFEYVSNKDEVLFVHRRNEKDVVILSLEKYNELIKKL